MDILKILNLMILELFISLKIKIVVKFYALDSLENIKKVFKKGQEYILILKIVNIKVNLKMELLREQAHINTQMEKYVKVNLVKDLEMDFALSNIQIIQV